MTNEKNFDVFISHHSSVKPWVIKLKDALEAKGVSVWLDKDEIRPGDLFAKALEDGLNSSRNIVFVISSSSMESKWVEEEYVRALSLSKSDQQEARLIPVIYEMAEIPGFLSSRNWVDFRDESEFSDNVDKLLWGVTGKKPAAQAKRLEIPFVVAAMTIGEAQSLKSETVFDAANVRRDEKDHFLQLLDSFESDLLNSWISQYSKRRDEWKPRLGQDKAIESIIWDMCFDFNTENDDIISTPILKPVSFTDDFFSSSDKTRINIWKKLERIGGILIVDAISMFHPRVRSYIGDSPLIGKTNKISIVVISPINSFANPTNKVIENKISTQMTRAMLRINDPVDSLCLFGAGDLRTLKSWFFSTLPKTAEVAHHQKPNLNNRKRIREIMGEPLGMQELIFGKESAS